MKNAKRIVSWLLCAAMILSLLPAVYAVDADLQPTVTVIDVTDFGADPSGANDSVVAVQKALEAAKEIDGPKTLLFPEGEYHFWPENATVERVWISNSTTPSSTSEEENTIRTIGILMRDIDDLTLEGDGSTFLFHGKMLSFMAQGCENLTIQNLTYDFVLPAVIDITVESVTGNEAIMFMPDVYNYEIVDGNNLVFYGENSPVTGQPYWTLSGHPYDQVNEMNTGETYRRWDGAKVLFRNVESIEDLGGMRFRFTYTQTPICEPGMNVHIKQTVRDNPSMLLWESENILIKDIRAMHMHSFGIVGQLSKDITVDNVEVVADERKGTLSAAAADMMQMSGCGGTITVKNCHYVNPGDDPINIHGTFLQIQEILAPNKIVVRYMQSETYGFPNYYVGDTVDLVSRNTLNTVKSYTVTEVENPDPNDWSKEEHKTITLTLDGDLPAEVTSANCSGYVMENVTYTPDVHITDCVFEESPVRGVLCTTRGKVVIENSVFRNMNMHSIFISDDANGWYESGYCRDVTIRNNIFELCNQSPIDFGPVVKNPDKNDPLHKNVTIEGNTFLLKNTAAITMTGVENVVIRNNTFLPVEDEVELVLDVASDVVPVGQSTGVSVKATTPTHSAGLFSFNTCKNVTLEGNHYGEGLNAKVSYSNMADAINVENDDAVLGSDNYIRKALDGAKISIVGSNKKFAASYSAGTITALEENPGGSNFYAVLETADGRVFESNWVTVKAVAAEEGQVLAIEAETNTLTEEGQTLELSVNTDDTVTWTAAAPDGSATEAVTVSDEGVVTAVANGVAEITATNDAGLSASMIVTVSIPGLAQAFTVEHPVDGHIKEVTADSVTYYPSQRNGFCDNVNNAENVLTIPIGTPENFEATVKLTGTTISTYEEVGFGILQDLDNYVSVSTKQHLGTMLYYEVATDFAENLRVGKISSPAYLRITKEGNTYTGYYRYSEDAEWVKIGSKDLSYSGELKLAMWAANRSSGVAGDFVWSELTINGEPVSFLAQNNAPEAANAVLILDQEQVNVEYAFADPDGHAQGTSEIYWYAAAEEEGDYRRLSGKTGTSLALDGVAGGQFVKALIVPVDVYGTPGAPVWSDAVQLPEKEGSEDDVYEGPSINADLRYVGIYDEDFNSSELSPAFDADTLRYIASIPTTMETATLELAPVNSLSTMTVTVNDEVLAEGVSDFSENITLLSGFNYIYVDVLAADGETAKTYRFLLVRPGYEDGTLADLKINGATVEGFDPETLSYQVVLDEPGEVTIEAAVNNHRARLMLSDGHSVEKEATSATYSVEPGTNTLIAAVRSESYGTYNYYKVNVKVPGVTTTDLNALTLAGVSMTGDNTGYTALPYITVTADAVDVDAVITVEGNGADFTSQDGLVEARIPLAPGENEITVTVTSGGETVTHTYTVTRNTDVYLSDIDYASGSVGYGSIMRDTETDGMPIRLRGEDGSAVSYEKGIGAHASSQIVYDIAGQGYTAFQAYVGIDYCQSEVDFESPADVTFKVYLNDRSGEPVFDSGVMTEDTPQKFVDIPLTEEDTKLILVIDGGSSINNDHADWADAKLIANPDITVPAVDVRLDKSEATLKPGETLTLTASVVPSDATEQTVTWATSDESVATVDGGVVTAVAEGEAVITVTAVDGGWTAQCVVTVEAEELENPFTDLTEDWYVPSVLWAYYNGITAGATDTTFEPDSPCTRAQVVTFLWRAAGKPEPKGDASEFTDLVAGEYYVKAVAWAVENGITMGTDPGKFEPDAPCTRAQIVTFLYRFAGEPEVNAENPFDDLVENEYYIPAVLWAVENEITAGDGVDYLFNPDGECLRCQIVTFLYRYLAE